jgi:hypothetical protein
MELRQVHYVSPRSRWLRISHRGGGRGCRTTRWEVVGQGRRVENDDVQIVQGCFLCADCVWREIFQPLGRVLVRQHKLLKALVDSDQMNIGHLISLSGINLWF